MSRFKYVLMSFRHAGTFGDYFALDQTLIARARTLEAAQDQLSRAMAVLPPAYSLVISRNVNLASVKMGSSRLTTTTGNRPLLPFADGPVLREMDDIDALKTLGSLINLERELEPLELVAFVPPAGVVSS